MSGQLNVTGVEIGAFATRMYEKTCDRNLSVLSSWNLNGDMRTMLKCDKINWSEQVPDRVWWTVNRTPCLWFTDQSPPMTVSFILRFAAKHVTLMALTHNECLEEV